MNRAKWVSQLRGSDPAGSTGISRREWISSAFAGAAVLLAGRRLLAEAPPIDVTVYKSPTCGCCGKWVDYMKKEGFRVTTKDMEDVTPVKRQRGVPAALYSCHTAVVADFVFEGHVPADLVRQVLRDKPAIAGLAAPGMPQSAPGMDIGQEKYEVMSFTKSGRTKLFAVRTS